MTLTPAVLQSIMYTFWGRGGEKSKKDEDSYPSMQVTLRAEGVQYLGRDQSFSLFRFSEQM